MIHSTRSCAYLSLKFYASLYELLLRNLLNSISIMRNHSRTYTESRWAWCSCSPGYISLNNHFQSNYFFLFNQIKDTCSISRSEIFNIRMRYMIPNLWRIFRDYTIRKELRERMGNLYCLRFDSLKSNKTIFLDSCR